MCDSPLPSREAKALFAEKEIIINSTLENEPVLVSVLPIAANTVSLQNAVASGVLLCKLLERWVPGSLNPSNIKISPKNKFDMLDNHMIMLTALKRIQCKIGYSLRALDMFDIKPHLLIALIWQILQTGIRRKIYNAVAAVHLEKDCAGMTSLQTVLFFFNSVLRKFEIERRIKNFTNDIADSVVYIYALHYLVPDRCSLKALQEDNLLTRASMVLEQINSLGFIEFITPEAIVMGNQRLNTLFSTYLFTHAYALYSGPRDRLIYYHDDDIKIPPLDLTSISIDSINPPIQSKEQENFYSSVITRLRQETQELSIREEALRQREYSLSARELELSPRDGESTGNSTDRSRSSSPIPRVNLPKLSLAPVLSKALSSPHSPQWRSRSREEGEPLPLCIEEENEEVTQNTQENQFPSSLDSPEASRKRLKRSSSHPTRNSFISTPSKEEERKENKEEPAVDEKKGVRTSKGRHRKRKKRIARTKSKTSSGRIGSSSWKKIEVTDKCKELDSTDPADITLAQIIPLVQYVSQQNAELKKQLIELRSQVTRQETSWELSHKKLSNPLTIEDAVKQCWKQKDECTRANCKIRELEEQLQAQQQVNEKLLKEASSHKQTVQRLQTNLADITMKKVEQEAVIKDLTPKERKKEGGGSGGALRRIRGKSMREVVQF